MQSLTRRAGNGCDEDADGGKTMRCKNKFAQRVYCHSTLTQSNWPPTGLPLISGSSLADSPQRTISWYFQGMPQEVLISTIQLCAVLLDTFSNETVHASMSLSEAHWQSV